MHEIGHITAQPQKVCQARPVVQSTVVHLLSATKGPSRSLIRQRRSFETNSPGRARSNKKRRCLIPASEETLEVQEEQSQTHISALPSDVLVKIFSTLELRLHRFVLPLVCRQWHDILSRPLGLWNHLDIDFAAEAEEVIPGSYTKNANKVRESRVLQWVKPRAAAVKSLRLRVRQDARKSQIVAYKPVHGDQMLHDFTGNGVAKLLLTVASPLEELVIECCQDILTDITFIAMSRLPNLTVLCLKEICTALSEQDFCAIAKLGHLQELVLDCEQPPEVEEGAEEIKWGLQTFPEGMLHLTNMTHLTLTCHYGITQLPTGLSKLNKLEVLNLDFCTLSKLPASLGQLTALTTLDVEGNLFLGDTFKAGAALPAPPSFPPELAGLQSLRYLNLNSCGLTQVPPVVSSMQALETLDLENNQLGVAGHIDGSMAPELLSLSRLQCLNLAQNKLTSLPEVVVKFAALRILDLTNNSLTNAGIPSSLTQLSHLKAIGLKRNNLTQVPPVLGAMRGLQEIYLENNPALEVESSLDFIAKLPNLRIIMMGKQVGNWCSASMRFMAELSAKLKLRHPEKEILRISYPGHEPGALPDDAYQTLM